MVKEIETRLEIFSKSAEGRSRIFAERIIHERSSDVFYEDCDLSKNSPDASFRNFDTYWPGVILEVSYSQNKKDVKDLADKYILGSDGNVCVIVYFNIGYPLKAEKATLTLSMWRSKFLSNDQGKQTLTADQTLDAQSEGLKLELKDFAALETAEGIEGSFLIDFETLSRFLSEAEQLAYHQKHGFRKSIPLGASKKIRARTPPEELNSEDEAAFANEKQMVESQAYEQDEPYTPS